MINVLEETVRSHDIVLQWRINKIASWMTLKSSEVQDCPWWIGTILVSFLVSSSSCHAFLPLVVRSMMTIQKMFLKIVFDSPEFNRSIISLGVDFHDEEDESISSTLHNRRLHFLLVQHRSKFFHQDSIVLVDELAESRLCGFALTFNRLAKSPAFNLNAYSSNCTSEVSCSLLFKFMRNSDPRMRVVFVRRYNSYLNSIFTLQATGCNFHYGSNFGVHIWQMCSRQVTASVNCENSAVYFVMKYCPIFNNIQESCIHTKLAQSVLLW